MSPGRGFLFGPVAEMEGMVVGLEQVRGIVILDRKISFAGFL